MPSGTVATVQNLNKRVEKKKEKKEKRLTKPLLQLQCYTVKYVGCTVPKYCSGIAAFYILRYIFLNLVLELKIVINYVSYV